MGAQFSIQGTYCIQQRQQWLTFFIAFFMRENFEKDLRKSNHMASAKADAFKKYSLARCVSRSHLIGANIDVVPFEQHGQRNLRNGAFKEGAEKNERTTPHLAKLPDKSAIDQKIGPSTQFEKWRLDGVGKIRG
ncbi:hypothetical protein [Hyphococcus sp.]|uniref:hypothetical protein n=1 Tax=Hyphococcus sp. TaxID=2038636 RepID=UPI003D108C67